MKIWRRGKQQVFSSYSGLGKYSEGLEKLDPGQSERSCSYGRISAGNEPDPQALVAGPRILQEDVESQKGATVPREGHLPSQISQTGRLKHQAEMAEGLSQELSQNHGKASQKVRHHPLSRRQLRACPRFSPPTMRTPQPSQRP